MIKRNRRNTFEWRQVVKEMKKSNRRNLIIPVGEAERQVKEKLIVIHWNDFGLRCELLNANESWKEVSKISSRFNKIKRRESVFLRQCGLSLWWKMSANFETDFLCKIAEKNWCFLKKFACTYWRKWYSLIFFYLKIFFLLIS